MHDNIKENFARTAHAISTGMSTIPMTEIALNTQEAWVQFPAKAKIYEKEPSSLEKSQNKWAYIEIYLCVPLVTVWVRNPLKNEQRKNEKQPLK